ncbi:MAG: DUF3054 family protein [Bacteroidota bacterium]
MRLWVLIVGDLIAIAIVTVIGFATHGETQLAFLPRMAALYLPLAASWFILAHWLGIFHREGISGVAQIWRPGVAMLFAAPMALVVRGLILNAPIIPLFGLILSATAAFGMMLWRAIAMLIFRVMNREPA